jgi:hypothetical protein
MLTCDRGNSGIDGSDFPLNHILNPQVENAATGRHIPYPGRLVTRSRHDESAISRKLERVDLLGVTLKQVTDAFRFDIPDLGRIRLISPCDALPRRA